jgi:hypothetical protein
VTLTAAVNGAATAALLPTRASVQEPLPLEANRLHAQALHLNRGAVLVRNTHQLADPLEAALSF